MQQEHYSVYRAILRAHGGEAQVFIFLFFWHFFSTCEKITQFLGFCKIKVAKLVKPFGLKLQIRFF